MLDPDHADALRRVANLALWCCLPPAHNVETSDVSSIETSDVSNDDIIT